MNNPWLWLVLGALIIAVLGGVAVYYVLQLRALRQRQAQQLQALEAEQVAQRKRINKSIEILSTALESDELSLTEASIRLSVLLDSLEVEESVREEFSAFYQLREATSHIPILKAWKELTPRQQLQFDKERLQHEATYGEFVRDAAKRIKGRQF
ncbi:DUF2489 domain-containing protein [Gilvimarinus xylanilyticus]|uniref:DUF2489 domain-containing protein n=1 Tax=Gilvimarinus xylanilyticus TaxID=2944139 RepID=A0A9X2KT43_9GAMM|nr:DUF2489 domain-containing protein [Gilvimarinus xylanilyticus]MCP8898393.1 DUF2489 domain-containing protein [Gilvimarinus xylanilyticus]